MKLPPAVRSDPEEPQPRDSIPVRFTGGGHGGATRLIGQATGTDYGFQSFGARIIVDRDDWLAQPVTLQRVR